MRDRTSSRVIGRSTLPAGADRKAPAASSAAWVRSTIRSSTARRASRTALAIPSGPKLPCATTTGRRRPSRIAPPTASGSSCSRSLPTAPLISSPPTVETGPERIASRIAPPTVFDVPSITFSAMLPVKPSVTTTSADAAGRSKPSTLPTKFSEPALQALARRQHVRRALARLLPDREQPHAGPLDALRRPP